MGIDEGRVSGLWRVDKKVAARLDEKRRRRAGNAEIIAGLLGGLRGVERAGAGVVPEVDRLTILRHSIAPRLAGTRRVAPPDLVDAGIDRLARIPATFVVRIPKEKHDFGLVAPRGRGDVLKRVVVDQGRAAAHADE